MSLPLAILLMGPTASGKTQLALHLHEHLPVDIISVDAAQVYRGMDIGTAKPTAAEQAQAPHRLIDIRDPAESYSAAEFCLDARREMEASVARGRIPLLVGGTMFYFRALEGGLSALPSADPTVRAQLGAEGKAVGWPAMHARLAQHDPETAARLNPNDAQRIQRALEVIALTGETPATINRRPRPAPPPFTFVRLALIPGERAWLHARIERRFHAMLELGLLPEVERLYQRGDLSPTLPALRTVGYRQCWNYLTGRIAYNQMIEQGVAATRQLAKRQLTWLRQYENSAQRFDCREATETPCLTYLERCIAA
jgi:tRNA dimethylallyltransferase